jgi:PKD repeat protein
MRTRTTTKILLLLASGCSFFASENEPPDISLDASMTFVKAQTPITFDITASDPEGGPLVLSINFGDGAYQERVASPIQHTYQQEGIYEAIATARDEKGDSSTASLTITVTAPGGPPNIRINGLTLHIDIADGPAETVTVNDVEHPVDGNGRADVLVPLGAGITSVDIQTQDVAGYPASQSLEFELIE